MSSTKRLMMLTGASSSAVGNINRPVIFRRLVSAVVVAHSLMFFSGAPLVAQQSGFGVNPFEQAPGVVPHKAAVTELLDGLQSPRFTDRRRAAIRLQAFGREAHAAFESAALSNHPERAIAALDLLKDAFADPDAETSESARKALERIARTKGSASAIAQQALRQADSSQVNPFGRPLNRPMQRARPVQPAPAFAPQPRNNLRIRIRNVNGLREIEVIENNRRFGFKDVPGGLQAERPDGKGGVERKVYEDAADMKQKDPEAFEKYQKAGGGTGGGLTRRPPNLLQELFGPPALRRIPAPKQLSEPPAKKPDGPRIELHPEIAPRPVPPTKPKRRPERKRVEV